VPVDPGWGVGIERPGQGLPRPPRPPHVWPPIQGPVDPGWGFPLPPVIDNTLPPTAGHPLPTPPDYPAHLPARPSRPVDPGYGVDEGGRPDQGLPPSLPVHPDQLPVLPPLGIWPPPAPVHPSHPIYPVPPGAPDQGLPGGSGSAGQLPVLPPGAVWPPLPPEIGGKIICFAWVVGVGYRWVILDPSLEIPVQLPTLPGRPPVAQPKA
jgi:hypothetical protein